MYQNKVKIHNWYEDQHLKQQQTSQFIHAIQSQQLLSTQITTHLSTSLQSTTLTTTNPSTNTLHHNNTIMLYNIGLQGLLAVDINDRLNVQSGLDSYNVTCSTQLHTPVVRNVFIVELVDRKDSSSSGGTEQENIIHYNQPIRLRLHPSLQPPNTTFPLYLQSIRHSHLHSTRQSHSQLVYISTELTYSTSVWKFQYGNNSYRYEQQLQPIDIQHELLITHSSTNQSLYTTTQYTTYNDFGKEYEVSGYSERAVGKSYTLLNEREGRGTVDSSSQKQESQWNRWLIVMGSSEEESSDQQSEKVVEEEKTQ